MGQKLWGHASTPPSPWQMHLDLVQKVASQRYLFVCPTVGVRGGGSPYKCSQYDISCSPRGQLETAHTWIMLHESGTRFSIHSWHRMAEFSPTHDLRPSMAPAACVPNTQVLLCPSLLLSVSDHRSFVEKIKGTQSRLR